MTASKAAAVVGSAEVALEKMCRRLSARTAFGRPLAAQSVWQERIAEARIAIDQCRLLTLHAADRIDHIGAKGARKEIGMIKVAAPAMLCKVVDWAIQAHGAAGVTEDFGLSYQYARARVMRIVDGPDEVHRNQIARLVGGGARHGFSYSLFAMDYPFSRVPRLRSAGLCGMEFSDPPAGRAASRLVVNGDALVLVAE